MRVAALVPARGGSTRVKRKNLRHVGGKSLLVHAIDAAHGARLPCYVSTEDDEIARVAAAHGAIVVARPLALATATATTEECIQHFIRTLPLTERPDAVAVLQPTSPLRTSRHVTEAIELLEATRADSVVSVVRHQRGHFAGRLVPRETVAGASGDHFTWTEFRPHRPIDYRPRTQDAPPLGEENGAIYLFTLTHWHRTQNRMGGTIAAYEMDEASSVDIDHEVDIEIADALFALHPQPLSWLRQDEDDGA